MKMTQSWNNQILLFLYPSTKKLQALFCAFTFLFYFVSLSFADSEVILPKVSLVTLSEIFPITIKISSEKPPTAFVLAHVEGPKLENCTLVDSKVSTFIETKKETFTYYLEWHFKAEVLGPASVTLPTLTFQDEKGNKEQKIFSEVLKVEVVRWHRKHRVLLSLGVGALILFVGSIFVRRKMKIAKEKHEILERAIAFKQLKIFQEQEVKEKIKTLSMFIISGEYGTFCHKLSDIFSEYFKNCHGLTQFPNDVGELRQAASKYFDLAFHGRLNQCLDLLEQIQFGAVRPLSGDLDRLPHLMLELIAIHREHGKK